MLESVYYENTSGEKVNLFSSTVLANFKEARPYGYTINYDELVNNGKDFSFIVLAVGRRVIDDLVSLMHKDVVAKDNGKLYINGWYLYCRLTGVRVINHESERIVKVELSFHAPSILWTKPTRYILSAQGAFVPQDELNSGDNFLDMDYDFDFDYSNAGGSLKVISNYQNEDADLIITASGSGDKFSINIAAGDFNNVYEVDEDITMHNVLVIDTERKKVTLDGVDTFTDVPDTSNIFRKLPNGIFLCVCEPSNAEVIVDVLEHRSVPLWEI